MENHNDSRRGNGEEVGIMIAGRVAPYQSGVLPRDFPQRLERLQEASGLTWNAFADAIGIDKKRVHRWRKRKKGRPRNVQARQARQRRVSTPWWR